MTYQIQLENRISQPLAVVRRRASRQALSKVIPAACGLVWNALRAKQIAGASRHVTVYLDDQINLEIGVELNVTIDEGGVVSSATPAGLVATTTHLGPYDRLHEAHQAIHTWCAAEGHKMAGPSWEIYGHWLDAWNNDPSQMRTDIYYLLKMPR